MKLQLWFKPTRLYSVSDQWGNLLQSPRLVYTNPVVVCVFTLVMYTSATYAVWLPSLVYIVLFSIKHCE